MPKARVYLEAMASFTVEVEVPDDLDEDEREEAAINAAHQEVPRICAQCSGWGRSWGKDEGEWEAIQENPVEWID